VAPNDLVTVLRAHSAAIAQSDNRSVKEG